MKKIYFFSIILVMIAVGCQQKEQVETVDLNATNDAVIQLLDEYLNAWNAKDIDALTAMVADDGLFCGSDPSELLDKSALKKMFVQLFSDTTINYKYIIDVRRIKLAEDGKSAIAIEHIIMSGWSPMLKMRQTFQIVKTNNKWTIDYIGWGFITKNENVDKLNKALE